MPRPSGKYTISGTRGADVISVAADGFYRNGQFTGLSPDQIDAGVIINGSAGNDTLDGGRGPDEINGGDGNDHLTGGTGLDKLSGGAGNDILADLDVLVTDGDPDDGIDANADNGAYFDGGRGIDTLDFSGSTVAVSAHLGGVLHTQFWVNEVNGRLDSGWAVTSAVKGRISNIENLVGSPYNDILWGNALANEIRGGDGHDVIVGSDFSGSDDRLFGDAGNDLLAGGLGHNRLTGGTGADDFVFDSTITGTRSDFVLDYSQAEGDMLVFTYTASLSGWTTRDHDGDGDKELVLLYDDAEVIVDNVTDLSQVTVVLSPDEYW